MKIMMADGKEVTTTEGDAPTYIVTPPPVQTSDSSRGGVTRKHVLVAVVGLLLAGITLTAILVGMHMFSQTQKDIVKFSLQFKNSNSEDVKQDVESDPNDNVVMTHVTKPGQDAYIVNDFNKGIQVVKLVTSTGATCYVSALNKSLAMDPGHISGPDSMNPKGGNTAETFAITPDPVVDRSFLTKKALDMCQGVSVYWVTRGCGQRSQTNSTDAGGRSKRAIEAAPFKYGMNGLAGCCKAYYACVVLMFEYVQGTQVYCKTYYQVGSCCGKVPYPYCANLYVDYYYSKGLIC